MRALHSPCTRIPVIFTLFIAGILFAQENYSSWQNAIKITINTTSGGANTTEAVTNFPLLVRLNSNNFNGFDNVQAQGADIRFSASNGDHLAYEIERWDGSGKAAEIWVKVPKIEGANSSQYIVMYWGKSGVSSESNGAAVFDTANGFEGVWHLADASGASAKDATHNKFDGSAKGTGQPADGAGVIGKGKIFDGKCGFEMNNTASSDMNFSDNSKYTLSAWANLDKLPPTSESYFNLINKSDVQYNLLCSEIKRWELTQFSASKQYEMLGRSGGVAEIKKWVHVAGFRDGSLKGEIWVDGEVYDNDISKKGESFARSEKYNVGIGKLTNATDFFFGKIDEARVESVARSVDWIKLCFQTQKESVSCLSFQPHTTGILPGTGKGSGSANAIRIVRSSAGVNIAVNNGAEKLLVIDTQGKTVFAATSGTMFVVPESRLSPGAYLVNADIQEHRYTIKFFYTK